MAYRATAVGATYLCGPEPHLWLLVPLDLGAQGFCRLSQPGSFHTSICNSLGLASSASLILTVIAPMSVMLSRNWSESLVCYWFTFTPFCCYGLYLFGFFWAGGGGGGRVLTCFYTCLRVIVKIKVTSSNTLLARG